MKVAELKRRLQVGVRLRLVNSLMGPCDKLRVVDGYDSVDVWFTGDGIKEGSVSHLRWPKAKELRETPDGFEVLEDGKVAASYVWVVEAGACRKCGKPVADNPPRYDSPGECRDCERDLNVNWLKGVGVLAEPEPDFSTEEMPGGLTCVQPLTVKAREWMERELDGEQTWQGGGLMVESAYVTDLVLAMLDDDLVQK